jgi:hypothetical protein
VNQYVKYLRSHNIDPAITASTGIAATHIGGSTIHSWSGIGIASYLSDRELKKVADGQAGKRINKAKILIIDEVSMIDAQTLDLVDEICQKSKGVDEPFGGLQVVLVGDFFQLPPISKNGGSSFAFESEAWQKLSPTVCYLTEQHRQEDRHYLNILNAIRSGYCDQKHIKHLETRLVEGDYPEEEVTKIFSHNANVDQINSMELEKLPGDFHRYEMKSTGPIKLVEALKKGCISPEELFLKTEAVVMFTKNNPKAGFVNGTLGKVVKFHDVTGNPIVQTRSGKIVETEPMEWMIEEDGMVRAKVTQIPLKLAWAVTVHKSQGMSLDAAIMDLRRVFEYGQGYVALSRVRSLSGLYLLGYNEQALMVHPEILRVDRAFQDLSHEADTLHSQGSPKEKKLAQENFILWAGGTIKAQSPKELAEKQSRADLNTFEKTLAMIKQGKSLNQICSERGLVESTIIGHLEKFVIEGKITAKELLPLVEGSLKKALPEIHRTFRQMNTTSLSPVYEYLNGKYSYRDLKIARIVLPPGTIKG